mgnify:CR=1 FL=1
MTRHRAPTICPTPGCPNDQPCPEHTPKPWAGSNQRRPDALRGRALQDANARIMTAHQGRCHICGAPGANRIDHIIPLAEGGPDTDTNKAPIHDPECHGPKTKSEAARGRARA